MTIKKPGTLRDPVVATLVIWLNAALRGDDVEGQSTVRLRRMLHRMNRRITIPKHLEGKSARAALGEALNELQRQGV